MKRVFYFSIVVTLLLGLGVISGCSLFPKSPESVVRDYLTLYKEGKFDKAATYLADANSSKTGRGLEIGPTSDSRRFAELISSQLIYQVKASGANGPGATVTVTVTALDLPRIYRELMPLVPVLSFSGDAQAGGELFQSTLENRLKAPQAPKRTSEVVVSLVKTKEGWRISPDNAQLFRAISGDLPGVIEMLEEAAKALKDFPHLP